jgi:hypothetical protein
MYRSRTSLSNDALVRTGMVAPLVFGSDSESSDAWAATTDEEDKDDDAVGGAEMDVGIRVGALGPDDAGTGGWVAMTEAFRGG